MTTTLVPASTAIDLRAIEREHHARIFAAFDALGLGDAFEILSDHDPQTLYHLLRSKAPGNFSWHYLQSGPDTWRVSIHKLGRAHGDGECCRVCGDGRA
jgi:uncharacterized protein (DUF2249 family)